MAAVISAIRGFMERIVSILALVLAIGAGAYAYVTIDRQRGEIATLNTKVETLTKTLGDTQKELSVLATDLAPLIEMIKQQMPGPELDMSALTPEKNAEFLANYEKQPRVQKTASGLLYKVITEGPAGGKQPAPTGDVTIHYRGTMIDGSLFDASYQGDEPTAAEQPPTLPLPQLIPGWVEALPMMKEGDVWELVLPASLAYGDMGKGGIPGGQALIFKIYLVKVP